MRKLFCGSEGRLGIVTRAALRLFPAQPNRVTSMIAVPDLTSAIALRSILQRDGGEFLTALEFFDDQLLGLTLRHIPGLRWPMETRVPHYILAELATSLTSLDLGQILERALEATVELGLVTDAVLAQSEAQRADLWRIREHLPEGTLREGRQLKHDIAVPVSHIPEFLRSCADLVAAELPGTRIWTFGHLADGNIHYNLSPPLGQADFGGHEPALSRLIYQTAEAHGGTFAAEHGIGRTKIGTANDLRSETERKLMATLQRAIDPDNMMNPGVVV